MIVQASIIWRFIRDLKSAMPMAKQKICIRLMKVGEDQSFGPNWDGCTNHVRYEVLKRLGYFVTDPLNISLNIHLGLLNLISLNY